MEFNTKGRRATKAETPPQTLYIASKLLLDKGSGYHTYNITYVRYNVFNFESEC